MAMIVLSSPATLTGPEEKKTGPSRFNEDFLTELTKLSEFRIYKHAYTWFTVGLHGVYTQFTPKIHSVNRRCILRARLEYTRCTKPGVRCLTRVVQAKVRSKWTHF